MAWATNASCGAAVAALNSFGSQSNGTGCWLADQTFSNFSVPTNISGQTTGTTAVTGSSTYSAVNTPWSDTATFSGVSAWSVSGAFAFLGGGASYLTNTQQNFLTETPPGTYHNPDPGQAVYITSASLAGVGSTGNNAIDSMSVTMTFCFGNVASCSAANTVTLKANWVSNSSTPTYTCTAGTTVTSQIQGCSSTGSTTAQVVTWASFHIPTLTVSNSISLTTAGNTTTALTSFSNTFGDAEFTPEPSTFVMLSSALLGLGGLHFRRRRATKKKDA